MFFLGELNMNKLGDLVRAKRLSLDLSLRDFAEKCKVSHTYIKKLENFDPRTGKEVTPSIKILSNIASVLEIPVKELIEKIGYPDKSKAGISPKDLKEIRGQMTYEEITDDIHMKVGERIEPEVYEAVEKGKEKSVSPFIAEMMEKYIIESSSELTPGNLTNNKDYSDIHDKELLNFINSRKYVEYLYLAKEIKEKGLDVRNVRNILFGVEKEHS